MRRISAVLRAAGFTALQVRSHGYLQIDEPAYMTSIVDRGADSLVARGLIGPDLADALEAEARRRADAGAFFGHIAYMSVVARRPA